MRERWYEIENVEKVFSPVLLIYPDRIEANIAEMLRLAEGPARLRPHLKTHKMSEVVQMQLAAGIDQFKCATIAEAEMAAACGARDVMWAYQPVGPNVARLGQLVEQFPETQFSALVDNEATIARLEQAEVRVPLLLDVDCGMQRSGIAPGAQAVSLYERLAQSKVVRPGGLHVYDGQIKAGKPEERERAVTESFRGVNELREELERRGMPVPAVVAGGSPTFLQHAQHENRQCSPGTTLLWDGAYLTKFPELAFLNAAMVLTRVVSRPGADLLCLDLGYKAVSPDNANPRVLFPELPDAEMRVHSEEHLTIRSALARDYQAGDCVYGIPWHICPTVALYAEAHVVRAKRTSERWKVVARDRRLTI